MRAMNGVWTRSVHLKLVLCVICLIVALPSIVDASLPIPTLEVPVIWKKTGEIVTAGWCANDQKWVYVETGELSSRTRHLLHDDLRRAGWRSITIQTDTLNDMDFWDELLRLDIFGIISLDDLSFSGFKTKATLGSWQLVAFVGEADSDRGDTYDYLAILNHEPNLRANLDGVLPTHCHPVPGSQLVQAYIPINQPITRGFYRFRTAQPMDTVVDHYARLPGWATYSLGVWGTFGGSEAAGLFLYIEPPLAKAGIVSYTIGSEHVF
ncbi:MAG: hypothetical protein GX998_05415 [Firmicutes bacterium]|nr:hypothetical protein [Bacillota bacterium]